MAQQREQERIRQQQVTFGQMLSLLILPSPIFGIFLVFSEVSIIDVFTLRIIILFHPPS